MSVTTACLRLLYYRPYLQQHVGGSLQSNLLGETDEPAKAFWVNGDKASGSANMS